MNAGETRGTAHDPVTITSTDPTDPATVTHSVALEQGANYLVFTGLRFSWAMPRPWVCWNAEGNPVPGRVIDGPGNCDSGTPNPEDAVQIVLGGDGDVLSDDEITSQDTNICVAIGRSAHGAVIEHDRIHDCGPAVQSSKSGFANVNEEWGWHTHGVYDAGIDTVIRNSYIYDNARDGVLLYGGGEGAVVEHNIIDGNGAGIWFGGGSDDLAAWNIVTASASAREVADAGIGAFDPGVADVAKDNCLSGNQSAEIEGTGFASSENKTHTNPLYVNASQHEYELQPDTPCAGYGPDTAQP